MLPNSGLAILCVHVKQLKFMRLTMKRRRSGVCCLWVLFLLLCHVATFAQESVPVSGTVLTEKGEVLQAVTVLATRRSDNPRQTVTAITNEKGIFTFPQLKTPSTR